MTTPPSPHSHTHTPTHPHTHTFPASLRGDGAPGPAPIDGRPHLPGLRSFAARFVQVGEHHPGRGVSVVVRQRLFVAGDGLGCLGSAERQLREAPSRPPVAEPGHVPGPLGRAVATYA